MWGTILLAITSNALVLIVLGFLCREIIKHWLNKDIQQFTKTIETEAKNAIAHYQSELEKERIKLQISYGGIFEKQADAIIELFKLVVAFERTIQFTTHAAGDKNQAYDAFLESWRNLVSYYEDHKILFPESIEEIFEKFNNGTFWSVHDYRTAEQRINRQNITNDQLDKLFTKQDKALADLQQVPTLEKELTNRLRALIGIM